MKSPSWSHFMPSMVATASLSHECVLRPRPRVSGICFNFDILQCVALGKSFTLSAPLRSRAALLIPYSLTWGTFWRDLHGLVALNCGYTLGSPGVFWKITSTNIPSFIVLCFVVLHRCWFLLFYFYKLKARLFTSKKVRLCFIAVVWDQSHSTSEVCCTMLQGSYNTARIQQH